MTRPGAACGRDSCVAREAAVGDRITLRATVAWQDGAGTDVTRSVSWEVRGAAATLAADGELVAVEPGEVSVRATLDGVASEPITLTVTAAP